MTTIEIISDSDEDEEYIYESSEESEDELEAEVAEEMLEFTLTLLGFYELL